MKKIYSILIVALLVTVSFCIYHYYQKHSVTHTSSTLKTSGVTPVPTYIPERNDYVCPKGWTPSGGWRENGVPTDPYRGVGCKELP